jgi:alanine racemase
LWGPRLPVAELAGCFDTIPYTLLTGLSRRVRIEYRDSEQL